MNDFSMERGTLNVTCRCNLKCRLCGCYIPYLRNSCKVVERDCPLEHWINVLDRYFEIVTHVNIFAVSGGEPLLYADLASVIHHLKRYKDSIGEMQIVTNGTIVPNQAVLEAVREFGDKAYFIVDNYGPETSKAVEEIDAVLKRQNIRYIIRNYTKDDPHCGGWVDYGDLSAQAGRAQKDAERIFAKCMQSQKLHFCFPITEGEMWPCALACHKSQLGLAGDSSEFIDLLDDTLSIEEQREKIRAIYRKKSLSACAYCNGMCEDSERFIPAVQLTGEELKCVQAGARSYHEVLAMMNK